MQYRNERRLFRKISGTVVPACLVAVHTVGCSGTDGTLVNDGTQDGAQPGAGELAAPGVPAETGAAAGASGATPGAAGAGSVPPGEQSTAGAQPPGAAGADSTEPSPGAAGAGSMEPSLTVPQEVPLDPTIDPGDVVMRRLNVAEYRNTIKDWLGIDVATQFPPDTRQAGFDNVSSALSVSQLHVTNFDAAAIEIVETLFTSDPGGVRAEWCSYQSGDAVADEACAAQIISDFAEQAWRRPHASWGDTDPMAAYLTGLSAAGPFAAAGSLEERMKLVLQAILVGPRFVFRVELAGLDGVLDVPSTASRLSYLLWSSAPDATTLELDLTDPEVLRGELHRMMFEDPRFQTRFMERFPDLWLELGRLLDEDDDNFPADDLFPDYDVALGAAMRQETATFFRGFVGAAAGAATPPLKQLLSAELPASQDPRLAAIYADSPRRGLLTQAAVLRVTSPPSKTSPVLRGKWVLEHLLCSPPPLPNAATQELVEMGVEEADPSMVARERLAIHRADPACAGCHAEMDPIGLGLENYDAIGAFREVDENGNVIDATGSLPGTGVTFANGVELAEVLANDPRVGRCMAQQLLTYGTGRLYTGDAALLNNIAAAAGGDAATFQSTLEAVVLSSAFRARKGSM